jgi:hypothetical protein
MLAHPGRSSSRSLGEDGQLASPFGRRFLILAFPPTNKRAAMNASKSGPNPDGVRDANVWQLAILAEAVDSPCADREPVGDLGDPQEAVPAAVKGHQVRRAGRCGYAWRGARGEPGPGRCRPGGLGTPAFSAPARLGVWVVKSSGFSTNGWEGWTGSSSLSVIFTPSCDAFAPSTTVPKPFRDRKVGGSNPLAPTH